MPIQRCGLILPHPWVGEIDRAIAEGLAANGCHVHMLLPAEIWDFAGCDILLTYGPMQPLQSTISRLKHSLHIPPLVVWFTEQSPWPGWPDSLLRLAAQSRYSWQVLLSIPWLARLLNRLPKITALLIRGGRLRALGEMLTLHRAGFLRLICVFTATNQDFLQRFSFPTALIPMGWAPPFGCPLSLTRDIDVVFLGSTRDRRRKPIIAKLEKELSARGISFIVKDGSPRRGFVFGQERAMLLNRTKIMLNIMRQPWDDPVFRLLLAAPNGAMVLSETLPRQHRSIPGRSTFRDGRSGGPGGKDISLSAARG